MEWAGSLAHERVLILACGEIMYFLFLHRTRIACHSSRVLHGEEVTGLIIACINELGCFSGERAVGTGVASG